MCSLHLQHQADAVLMLFIAAEMLRVRQGCERLCGVLETSFLFHSSGLLFRVSRPSPDAAQRGVEIFLKVLNLFLP